MKVPKIEVLFEDNHIIAINKTGNDLSQKDNTGDLSLDDKVKIYLKKKYNKPGDVFLGIPHRIDRPTSGVIVYARTSKALTRLTKMFREKEIEKKYWAIVKNKPSDPSAMLTHHLVRDPAKNKSFCHTTPVKESKEAKLCYRIIASSDKYFLLEIDLLTGRHHQIRSQLSFIGCPIKGDLKYGFDRSNKDGGISLHARSIGFEHPVTKEKILINAPVPTDPLWKFFEKEIEKSNI